MSRNPEIPESLRRLIEAQEKGELPDGVSDEVLLEGITDKDEVSTIAGDTDSSQTNNILLRIVNLLEELPSAIWDEVEGR